MPRPTVSLIVSTYNWKEALALVLRSVLEQSELPLEVLVADDGSREDTRALVADFAARFPIPLVHVWHEDTGFRLAEIRNRAIAVARGEYLVSVDGDFILHPRFIESHRRFARRGRYMQGSRVMLDERLAKRALAEGRTRFGLFTPGLGNRVNGVYAPWLAWTVPSPQTPWKGTRGVHMAFWRDDVVRVNGFNEAFVGWGREDSEFAARMLASGVKRKNFKFAAIGYHIHHPVRQDSETTRRNHEIYEAIRNSRATWAERGLDRHLKG